jgi:hypothetical protein
MIPVLKKYDLIKIVVLAYLSFFGSVHNKWSNNPIDILRRKMRVVPICAELVVHGKVVEKALSWWDGTLRDSRRSVHPVSAILENAMPVQGCSIG